MKSLAQDNQCDSIADKRLIIGLGSGKCGTMSLATLLNNQVDASFSHEGFANQMRRHFNNDCLLKALKVILARESRIIGDVAYYWIHYVKSLLLNTPTKFICLKRDRTAVIESFWTGLTGEPIDTLPQFSGMKVVGLNLVGNTVISDPDPFTLDRAKDQTGEMWDAYYGQAEHFERLRLTHFRIFSLDKLNSEEGVKEILDFAEIPEENQVVEVGIWENKRRALLNGRQGSPQETQTTS